MKHVVFVDTSAFHALQNSSDADEHQEAKSVAEELELEGSLLVSSDYVLDEAYTLLRASMGHRVAVNFGREIQNGGIEIVQVDESLQQKAWSIFEKYSDKDFSFTDCTSFATMNEGKLQAAFTFDHHFRQYGFETLPSVWPLSKR